MREDDQIGIPARTLALTYLLALIPAVFLSVAQPAWTRTDEAAHFDYVAQLAHANWPVVARTTIRPETLRITVSTGVYRWDSYYSPPPDVAEASIGPAPTDLTPIARAVWAQRHLWIYSYEALQPPAYYLAAVPVWWVGFAVGGDFGSLVTLRFVNALLAALIAPLAVLMTWSLRPQVPFSPWIAGSTGAVLPGYLLTCTSVTNDTAAAVIGSLLVLLAARWARWLGIRRALALGLLAGGALLIKLNTLALAPAIAAAVLLPNEGLARNRRVWALAVAAATAAACVLPWITLNEYLYHSPTPALAGRWLNTSPAPWTFSLAFISVNVVNAFITFWTGEPSFLALRAALWILPVVTVLACASATGLFRLLRTRPETHGYVAVLGAAVAGVLVIALVLPLLSADSYRVPGRYLYPALGPALALFATGLASALRGRAVAVASIALVGASIFSLVRYPDAFHRPEYGPRHPAASARELAGGGVATLASFRVAVDAIEVDKGGLWLHVRASTTDTPYDWRPLPDVFDDQGRLLGTSDYPSSTPLPETVTMARPATGWIHVKADVRQLDRATQLTARFPDIAPTDDYRTISDLAVPIGLESGR